MVAVTGGIVPVPDPQSRPARNGRPARENPETRAAPGSSHRRWPLEILIIAFFYLAYELSRKAVPSNPVRADDHAGDVMSVERVLHLNVERSLNTWLAHHDTTGAVVGYYYGTLHFIVTIAVLVWLFLRRPVLYTRARTILVLASFGALLVFWFYPVAPPRLAEPGLTDVVFQHNVFGVAHSAANGGFVNIYAAVPSLHVGWAVWAALSLIRAEPQWRFRYLLWLYPLATTYVVVASANHYVVDAVAGFATILLGGLALRVFRARWFAMTDPRQDA